jgi:hypothetical protein
MYFLVRYFLTDPCVLVLPYPCVHVEYYGQDSGSLLSVDSGAYCQISYMTIVGKILHGEYYL